MGESVIFRELPQPSDSSPLISIQHILRSLRTSEIAPDELLLHSGGPISDISQTSLLMGPPTHRTLLRQPMNESPLPFNRSPLDGDLIFHTSNPLIIEQQIWTDSNWKTIKKSSATSLSQAMKLTCQHVCTPSPDGMPSIGTVAGLLGYDLVQWTSPVGLHALPEANSVLGVMYRISAYILHNRSTNQLHLVSEETHPWADITELRPMPPQPLQSGHSNSIPESTSDQHHTERIRRIIESLK